MYNKLLVKSGICGLLFLVLCGAMTKSVHSLNGTTTEFLIGSVGLIISPIVAFNIMKLVISHKVKEEVKSEQEVSS